MAFQFQIVGEQHPCRLVGFDVIQGGVGVAVQPVLCIHPRIHAIVLALFRQEAEGPGQRAVGVHLFGEQVDVAGHADEEATEVRLADTKGFGVPDSAGAVGGQRRRLERLAVTACQPQSEIAAVERHLIGFFLADPPDNHVLISSPV